MKLNDYWTIFVMYSANFILVLKKPNSVYRHIQICMYIRKSLIHLLIGSTNFLHTSHMHVSKFCKWMQLKLLLIRREKNPAPFDMRRKTQIYIPWVTELPLCGLSHGTGNHGQFLWSHTYQVTIESVIQGFSMLPYVISTINISYRIWMEVKKTWKDVVEVRDVWEFLAHLSWSMIKATKYLSLT